MSLRRHVFVRPVRADEAQQYWDWLIENRTRNLVDPEVVSYPSTLSLCAYNQDGPLAYMPIQRPYMMESLAPRPGSSAAEQTQSLKELLHTVVTEAHRNGSGEIYFLSSDAETTALAESNGFELVPVTVYRLKLSKLEPKESQ